MSGRLWGSDMEEGRYKLDDFELYKVARAFRKRAYSLLIAEGHGRWHYQENIRFCRISRGSVDELIDDFSTCEDEGYGDQALVAELKIQAYDLIHRINSYIAYLRKTKQGGEE